VTILDGWRLAAQSRKNMSSASCASPANPLLDFSDLPPFDRVRPEHIVPAVDVLLAGAARQAVHT